MIGAMQIRAIPAPLAREPWRRCEQCVLREQIGGAARSQPTTPSSDW